MTKEILEPQKILVFCFRFPNADYPMMCVRYHNMILAGMDKRSQKQFDNLKRLLAKFIKRHFRLCYKTQRFIWVGFVVPDEAKIIMCAITSGRYGTFAWTADTEQQLNEIIRKYGDK